MNVPSQSLHRRWLMCMLAVGALAGCGPKKKIAECQAFVTSINEGVDRIHKAMGAPPEAGQSVAELRSLATEMDGVGKQTEKVALSLPELQKFSQRYLELTKDIATTARELADAVDAVDVEKSTKLQARMDEIVKKEDPLVEELNRFCLAP
ncbi:MAG: hypothetical protein FJ096_17855 [Deltaproteobacteria bacterium]|nr:hypothetical protein [Deltaproteobacteria bacterium]